ncbi:transcriptional regulator, TraR/DksA family [Methylophilus rhizosphaerae]|uniref:RNA polymerase-binding transcription factor DksA n=1 Tax=Methylophilus rhizosphaerae TaxID=492660 RepID=A0A1G8ZA54_9PROT|nr:RNA polymerase-binding protein DksA [Methylophilus rhizosphaerae]SDK11534.1 transcriptional regulator, TraR/DksA family [Methylophilus rhizosphaerae]
MLNTSELLAMPEDAYMNKAQLAFFKQLLQAQLQALQGNMQSTSKHLLDQQETPDPADRATQEETQSLELRTRERERKHVKTIHAALLRIEHGDYGYCEETGEPIGLARLLARPTTKLCLEAQERHERRERQFNH